MRMGTGVRRDGATLRLNWMDVSCDEESSHHPRTAPSCHSMRRFLGGSLVLVFSRPGASSLR